MKKELLFRQRCQLAEGATRENHKHGAECVQQCCVLSRKTKLV